jgi:hypothetical protein
MAALAFAAFVAQPLPAKAGSALLPLWIASSAVCEAIVIADAQRANPNGVVIGHQNGKLLLCLVPGFGLALALADQANKQPKY